jgi:hypothetical protein
MPKEDVVNSLRTSAVRGAALAGAAFVLLSTHSWAQSAASDSSPGQTASAVHELQDQVHQLRDLVEQMRAENAQSRAEMQQLRQDLQTTRALLQFPATGTTEPSLAGNTPPSGNTGNSTGTISGQKDSSIEQRVEKLEESTSLIGNKIDEQYQTKVETTSRYRARLHGIILMNAFRNVGGSDSLDFPTYAQPAGPGAPQATLGATLRQSEVGLELFGPHFAGADTSADVQFDFAGGFPNAPNGVNFGIVRLQTASVRMDWEHTSVVAGQDPLFISPLSPTSFASLSMPAFTLAGNLWGWTPQLRIEHRFSISDDQTVTMQAGILDNLDWEFNYDSFYRTAQAGEMSGQPAYALRTAWARTVHQRPLSLGVAGYFGRQNWTARRIVDAWSGMADWQIPILSRLALSGEFYRGRGVGGLGGGIGQSILYGGNPSYGSSVIRGLDAAGGWTQLKFQLTPKLEFNGVIAEDDAFASNIRGFATDQNNGGSILGRNRGALANIILRPRSDLVLAAEFRRLRTFPVYSTSSATNQVNLSVGMLF